VTEANAAEQVSTARIFLWPSPVLRDHAYPYLFDQDITRLGAESIAEGGEGTVAYQSCQRMPLEPLLSQMVTTMYAAGGIGLAGPQIGVPLRVAVIDIGDGKLIRMVNPILEAKEGEMRHQEGCLSLPGGKAMVTRAEKVIVTYRNPDGTQAPPLAAGGILAVVLQHELDHLQGKCIADVVGLAARAPLKRLMSKTKDQHGPSYLPGGR
jgi:peptide deformylase